jgi:hypothetical protein
MRHQQIKALMIGALVGVVVSVVRLDEHAERSDPRG